MKNLILCHSLYQDISSLSALVSSMEFDKTPLGDEIKNFNFIPHGLDKQFEQYVDEPIEIQSDTGVFRKPSNLIHFEPFYQHASWLCIVALEETTFKIHEQENIKNIFDVENLDEFVINNCLDESKWQIKAHINMKTNDFIFVRPWLWHSLTPCKLIQYFLLNKILEG